MLLGIPSSRILATDPLKQSIPPGTVDCAFGHLKSDYIRVWSAYHSTDGIDRRSQIAARY